jgi:hypothetical protein
LRKLDATAPDDRSDRSCSRNASRVAV